MSDKQLSAARANGAKSRGPKTESGRQRSSLNAITHGLCSELVLLPTESHEAFDHLRGAYVARFQPADPVELDLIDQMVAATWRLRRAWAMETEALTDAMEVVTPELQKLFKELPDDAPLCAAMKSLMGDDSQFLANLSRHEARHARLYHRAFQNFLRLRQAMPPAPPPGPLPVAPRENTQNEPKPSPAILSVTKEEDKNLLSFQSLPAQDKVRAFALALPLNQDGLESKCEQDERGEEGQPGNEDLRTQ